MENVPESLQKRWVAPLAGARIEICIPLEVTEKIYKVAPLAGARIEISHKLDDVIITISRSPRGSAD